MERPRVAWRALFAVLVLSGNRCSKSDETNIPAVAEAMTASVHDRSSAAVASTSSSASAFDPIGETCDASDCPLNAWMRGNTAPAILSGDFDDLTAALDRLAGMAPSGYPNWASIARDGANAARAQSIEAVRAACRSCHAQYRDRYRHELRSRPLP